MVYRMVISSAEGAGEIRASSAITGAAKLKTAVTASSRARNFFFIEYRLSSIQNFLCTAHRMITL